MSGVWAGFGRQSRAGFAQVLSDSLVLSACLGVGRGTSRFGKMYFDSACQSAV